MKANDVGQLFTHFNHESQNYQCCFLLHVLLRSANLLGNESSYFVFVTLKCDSRILICNWKCQFKVFRGTFDFTQVSFLVENYQFSSSCGGGDFVSI
jgi:hypothetical protein